MEDDYTQNLFELKKLWKIWLIVTTCMGSSSMAESYGLVNLAQKYLAESWRPFEVFEGHTQALTVRSNCLTEVSSPECGYRTQESE